MKPQLTIPQWLALEAGVKERLINLFGIPRTGTTHVVDNKIATDGYTHHDLAFITLEKLQALLDSDSKDFFELFNEMIDTIKSELIKATDIKYVEPETKTEEQDKEGTGTGNAPKTRGRKKKEDSKGSTVPTFA